MTQVSPVAALAAREEGLRRTADVLRSAFRHPAMQALVTDAVANLEEAKRWLVDVRLEDSDDCRLWVDGILRVAARRLMALEQALQTHGPDATGVSG